MINPIITGHDREPDQTTSHQNITQYYPPNYFHVTTFQQILHRIYLFNLKILFVCEVSKPQIPSLCKALSVRLLYTKNPKMIIPNTQTKERTGLLLIEN
jgi:hypothetical protein